MKNLVVVTVTALLAANVVLMRGAWNWGPEESIVALAFTSSQMSLITVWASFSRWKSYVRYALLVCTGFCIWYLVCRLFPWNVTGLNAAGWATTLVVQSMFIWLAIVAGKLVKQKQRGEPVRYSVQPLLCWTAALAVSLAIVRLGVLHWAWSSDFVTWQYLGVFLIIGICNASYALLTLVVFLRGISVFLRLPLAAAFFALLACSQPLAFQSTFGEEYLDTADAMLLGATQVAFLLLVLVPACWLSLAGQTTKPGAKTSAQLGRAATGVEVTAN